VKSKLAVHCLPYVGLLKTASHYTTTLKIATLIFVETLDNFRHLNTESEIYTQEIMAFGKNHTFYTLELISGHKK
jgi:hypothetical protein